MRDVRSLAKRYTGLWTPTCGWYPARAWEAPGGPFRLTLFRFPFMERGAFFAARRLRKTAPILGGGLVLVKHLVMRIPKGDCAVKGD